MPFHFLLSFSASPSSHLLLSLSKSLSFRTLTISAAATPPRRQFSTTVAMSISLNSHAFAGNPTRLHTPRPTDPFSATSAFQSLKTLLLSRTTQEPSSPDFKVLPFRKGRPLVGSFGDIGSGGPNWRLGWLSLGECRAFLENSDVSLAEDLLVYLGHKSEQDSVYWAIDVSEAASDMVTELGSRQFCFVELRTLMVATDWSDANAMGDLAVAGHARALLEWHITSRFCGYCGSKTVPMEAGRRKSCSNEQCKKRIYPRVDPVVIMLVIDKENDRALLSKQARFVPRMWSCLAGFIEPGESLEEAVRRETWEETGIEVGEVVYHSSQPWPVGPGGIPCQLMVGFHAYAKSLDINVDKEELEDAQWHSREDIKKALAMAEYKKAQRTAAAKVDQICKGVEKSQSLSADFNVESGELAPMFFPGPFAIAHHLISSWAYANDNVVNGAKSHSKSPASSISNL